MAKRGTALPTAVVINLDYTGMAVVRSLSAHGIPVVGLSAHRTMYGMFTRRARTFSCPDSGEDPEGLLEFLLRFARELNRRAIIFPTCDHDLILLDRFREQLEPYYALAIAEPFALNACLDKWETYLRALDVDVPAPKSWMITGPEDVERALPDLAFPCLLKPVASYHWRKAGNWKLVGARKACRVSSPEELRLQYAVVARADSRVLLQQLIPGGDESLVVAACYFDRNSNWVAGFNTQKLTQSPPGLGSGSIVQSADLPELFEPTRRLLQYMRFTGMAEVEYKWDCNSKQYMLIEINPRAWEQLLLGSRCGVDLPYLDYCELAGLPVPLARYRPAATKWIAEDRFFTTLVKRLWVREQGAGALLRLLKGQRIYAIWEWSDPLPAIAYFTMRFFPGLAWSALRRVWRGVHRLMAKSTQVREPDAVYESHFKEASSKR